MAAFPEITNGFELSPASMDMFWTALHERAFATLCTGGPRVPATPFPSLSGGIFATTLRHDYGVQGGAALPCLWWMMESVFEEIVDFGIIDYDGGGLTRKEFFASVAAWRAAAGLNAGGYRRGEDGASYGIVQHGDPLRGWILDDIVKACKAIKMTAFGSSYVSYTTRAEHPGDVFMRAEFSTTPRNGGTAWMWERHGTTWTLDGFYAFAAGDGAVVAFVPATGGADELYAYAEWSFSHE